VPAVQLLLACDRQPRTVPAAPGPSALGPSAPRRAGAGSCCFRIVRIPLLCNEKNLHSWELKLVDYS
ncbi:unnamed protein product, partial [Lepidochelys kempii]